MRVLLDECVDRRLGREIVGHDVQSVPDAGWAGIKNGELLRLAQSRFDVFITTDRNLEYEQNLQALQIAVVVLQGNTNRIDDLRRLVPTLLTKIAFCRPGTVTHITGD